MGVGINIGIEIGAHYKLGTTEPATVWFWEDGTTMLWEDGSEMLLEGAA